MAIARQCCVCLRVHVPAAGSQRAGGEWRPHPQRLRDASHTYCPECLREALVQLDLFRQQVAAQAP